MKQIVIILSVCMTTIMLLTFCGKNPVEARLTEIETFAASNPDSARRALESIDPSFLNTRRLQAQHALMLSTALSRCKIKVPDDSLINIAVDYYDRYGPRKERFLSYYYRGRIYEDLEVFNKAMENYVAAESIRSKDISLRYWTSLYLRKGLLYRKYYVYDRAVESYQKARDYANRCNWRSNYFASLVGELTTNVIFEKTIEADSMIHAISPFRNEMPVQNRMAFDNDVILTQFQMNAKLDSILVRIRTFEEDYSSRGDFPWASLSLYYAKVGDYSKSKWALDQYPVPDECRDSDKRFLLASSVLKDCLGDLHDSQKDQNALHQLLYLEFFDKNESNLRFVEDVQWREKRSRHLEEILYYILILGAIGGLGMYFILLKRKNQRKELLQLYSSLEEEYVEMSALFQSNVIVQEEARALLGKRVMSLAQFFSAERPSSLDKVADQLDSLTENRKELLETIGLLYAVYYPSFVNRLQAYNLSNGEIGFCCLLVLGFRTGEIGNVINRSSSYHISSAIRQKVGLGPKDTNLSIFLKEIFKATES